MNEVDRIRIEGWRATAAAAAENAADAARMPEHRDEATTQSLALVSIAQSLSVIADALVLAVDDEASR